MARSLKLANLWRVIRDVDLEAIRIAVNATFELLIVADDREDAVALRALLGPDRDVPHPWLAVEGAADPPIPPAAGAPVAGLLLSRALELSPGLEAARARLVAAGRPVVTVVVGSTSRAASVVRAGEAARLGVPSIDTASAAEIGRALVGALPADARYALARHLPLLRPQVFSDIIEETARANATFALTTGLAETVPVLTAPLNLGDMVVLTKNQLLMCYRLAIIAGREGDPKKLVAEILGVLGGGLLFRQIARQLVGLIPVVGLLPKIAVAYGGTWAIGRAMTAWVTEGRAVTAESVKAFSSEGLSRGREVARALLEQARANVPTRTRAWQRIRQQVPWIGRRRT
jgi:uncharacterized protein (DUF697 family)